MFYPLANLTNADALTIGMFAGLTVVYCIFVLGVAALQIVALWKIFTKAGEDGWKVLIPFYGSYTQYKIAWKTGMFWWTLGLALGGSALSAAGAGMLAAAGAATAANIALMVLGGALIIAAAVLEVICTVHLGRRFGKSGWFIFGMIVLPCVFLSILAFGKSTFNGTRDC